ncbi:MAG TPA: MFS transporter [Hyphomonadaceae bacterium]|nr:MFS transporter [Hyphomonadaceae bacterium]
MTIAHVSTEAPAAVSPNVSRLYAWAVFALTFGLLMSDYMSRQVLNALFPMLKSEWGLSDAQLGGLSSIVALMVGILTLPLSFLADHIGRARSLFVMAVIWSIATAACALARNYQELFFARFIIGVGEAAYGSVGVAVVVSVFPPNMRATIVGAFMAGGMFGSVLGVSLGGIVASNFGWRWAFGAMAIFGLLLAIIFLFVVTERRIQGNARPGHPEKATGKLTVAALESLIGSRAVLAAYAGSGLQLFVCAALPAWLPSFFNRAYSVEPGRAAVLAAVFVLIGALGMIAGGLVSDRLSKKASNRVPLFALVVCLLGGALLAVAFQLPTGIAQLVLIGLGLFVAAAITGPAGAMVANLTHLSVHGAAFAVLTLVNNFLGLAPGPYVTGLLADQFGLTGALQLIPVTCLAAAILFWLASRSYGRELAKAP